eukprot:TRINITY_DN39500_c0_g1_i1.p1 TRINITY_DN39500_c0_g1~~TRINITY_DN39500_c0_g1_i1.p1  ORF type:complete len:869 (+),score=175.03 TRINITY_DN39500_c0_g1_i1:70-2676(+)
MSVRLPSHTGVARRQATATTGLSPAAVPDVVKSSAALAQRHREIGQQALRGMNVLPSEGSKASIARSAAVRGATATTIGAGAPSLLTPRTAAVRQRPGRQPPQGSPQGARASPLAPPAGSACLKRRGSGSQPSRLPLSKAAISSAAMGAAASSFDRKKSSSSRQAGPLRSPRQLQQLQQQERASSASRIQGAYRDWCARREPLANLSKAQQAAARCIQRWYRMLRCKHRLQGILARLWWRMTCEVLQVDGAARRLQGGVRMVRLKGERRKARVACLQLQAWWRGAYVRSALSILRWAALRVQRWCRRTRDRRRLLAAVSSKARQMREARSAATKLQSAWRGRLPRRRLGKARRAAAKLQSVWRGRTERRRVDEVREEAARRRAAEKKITKSQALGASPKKASLLSQSGEITRRRGLPLSSELRAQARMASAASALDTSPPGGVMAELMASGTASVPTTALGSRLASLGSVLRRASPVAEEGSIPKLTPRGVSGGYPQTRSVPGSRQPSTSQAQQRRFGGVPTATSPQSPSPGASPAAGTNSLTVPAVAYSPKTSSRQHSPRQGKSPSASQSTETPTSSVADGPSPVNQERGRLPYRDAARGAPALDKGYIIRPNSRLMAGLHPGTGSSSIARGGSASSSVLSARSGGGALVSPRAAVADVEQLLADLLQHGLLSCQPKARSWEKLPGNLDLPGSSDLDDVRSCIAAALPSAEVRNVLRVECTLSGAAYAGVRQTLGPEKLLWHGTSWDSVANIVQNGFNRAYSGRHGVKLGRGSYFTEDANYALRFCGRQPATRAVFLAGVLPGRCCKGEENLVEPPRLDEASPAGGRYDSTVDDVENPKVYCVFRDFQALPLYLAEVAMPAAAPPPA